MIEKHRYGLPKTVSKLVILDLVVNFLKMGKYNGIVLNFLDIYYFTRGLK